MVEHDLDRSSALDMTIDDLDDGALVELTRQGSNEAYAVLYDRYVYSARRLARHLGQRDESDDVVSDAFAQILGLLQRGKGPDSAFRAYLFTAVRHECGRRAKAVKRVMPTDDDAVIDSAVPFGAGELDDFEKTAVRAAYESLPERWRTVLWHLDVEGRKPHELAEVLGLKPNSVSALVYRARAGLREAYLKQHVGTTDESQGRACEFVREHVAAVVRRTASRRDQEKVHAHLETCTSCLAVHLDLQEVNREVGSIAAPTAAAGAGGLASVVATVKDAVVAAAGPTAAAAVAGVAMVSVSAPWDPSTGGLQSRAERLTVVRTPSVPATAPRTATPVRVVPSVGAASALPVRTATVTPIRRA